MNNINMEFILLWVLRIGVLVLLVGILYPKPSKKSVLKKRIFIKQENIIESSNPFVKLIEDIMENSFLKIFKQKNQKKYDVMQAKINKAGGLYHATPNFIQFFRIILPFIGIVIGSSLYVASFAVNTYSVNKLLNTPNLSDKQESILQLMDVSNALNGVKTLPQFNWLFLLWIIVLSLSLFFLPELVLKYFTKKHSVELAKEIPIIRTFTLSLLETKIYSPYDVLSIVIGTSYYLKEDISNCLNKYFINPKLAIKELAEKIGDDEMNIICNGLIRAVDEDKEISLIFLKQQLIQHDMIKELKYKEKIKKKPSMFVMVLGIPMLCILIIWFYPWFMDAMSILNNF